MPVKLYDQCETSGSGAVIVMPGIGGFAPKSGNNRNLAFALMYVTLASMPNERARRNDPVEERADLTLMPLILLIRVFTGPVISRVAPVAGSGCGKFERLIGDEAFDVAMESGDRSEAVSRNNIRGSRRSSTR